MILQELTTKAFTLIYSLLSSVINYSNQLGAMDPRWEGGLPGYGELSSISFVMAIFLTLAALCFIIDRYNRPYEASGVFSNVLYTVGWCIVFSFPMALILRFFASDFTAISCLGTSLVAAFYYNVLRYDNSHSLTIN